MGPRACSFWVEMPISQPRPNSPPSVKRVEQFTYTAALSTAAVNRSASACVRVRMASLWPVECCACLLYTYHVTLCDLKKCVEDFGDYAATIREDVYKRQTFARALAAAKAKGRNTVHVKVWLPLPAACPAQSNITLDSFTAQPTYIAPETAPQRTAYWEADLAAVSYTHLDVYKRQRPCCPS